MKTWNLIDKTQWPERGPWDNEPDKAQWTDEATGFACLMVRGLSHWCGYVGVPEGHPAFGKGYDDVNVDAHGGLTFAGLCQEGEHEPRICHIPEEGQADKVWWLGFDCAHLFDKRPAVTAQSYAIEQMFPDTRNRDVYRDFEYVKQEVTRLAAQLKA